MSSVRKRNQTPHKFTTLDIILDMYDYTSQIISNDKVFDRTYKSLIDRIDNEASMIYHLCRTANEDYDNRNEEEAQIRLKLEEEAIDYCLWLKTDIRLAQKKFHLRAKRAAYWTSLVNECLKAIKGWRAAETREYKSNYGL